VRVRYHPGQHPDRVADACVRRIREGALDPRNAVLTRRQLTPYAPEAREFTGSWVPYALQDWARGLVFFREPPGPGRPGEILQSLPVTVWAGGGDCDDCVIAQGTMAQILGFQVAVGRLWLGPSQAHLVCAVSPDWLGSPGLAVIDPELGHPASIRGFPDARWALVL
jgi:hypothetical protein